MALLKINNYKSGCDNIFYQKQPYKKEEIMKVFVWNRIRDVSDNYHSEGGLVVFAADEERARIIANETDCVSLSDSEIPNKVVDVAGTTEESVHTFPDAGCC